MKAAPQRNPNRAADTFGPEDTSAPGSSPQSGSFAPPSFPSPQSLSAAPQSAPGSSAVFPTATVGGQVARIGRTDVAASRLRRPEWRVGTAAASQSRPTSSASSRFLLPVARTRTLRRRQRAPRPARYRRRSALSSFHATCFEMPCPATPHRLRRQAGPPKAAARGPVNDPSRRRRRAGLHAAQNGRSRQPSPARPAVRARQHGTGTHRAAELAVPNSAVNRSRHPN